MPIIFQIILCISLIALLFIFPQASHLGAEQGTKIFMDILLPYLLPYLLLTNWLFALLQQRSISARFAFFTAYISSAVGGYPVGAIAVLTLYKQQLVTKRQTSWLLPFLHSPNPFFVMNYVGVDLLNNIEYSIIYLAIHHILCITAVVIIYKKSRTTSIRAAKSSFSSTSLLQQTIQTTLIIATTIIFFSSLTYICVQLFLTAVPLPITVFVIGALELTNGLQFAASQLQQDALLLYLTFLLSSQSISIHLQVAAIVIGTCPIRPYIVIRTLFSIVLPIVFFIYLF